MATRIYGISQGEQSQDVTEGVGAAVAADSVELTVDLAASLSKQEVLKALKQIEIHITKGNWPPA